MISISEACPLNSDRTNPVGFIRWRGDCHSNILHREHTLQKGVPRRAGRRAGRRVGRHQDARTGDPRACECCRHRRRPQRAARSHRARAQGGGGGRLRAGWPMPSRLDASGTGQSETANWSPSGCAARGGGGGARAGRARAVRTWLHHFRAGSPEEALAKVPRSGE